MGPHATAGGVSRPRSRRRRSHAAVKQEALRIGFDLVGVAPAVAPATLTGFHDWLEKGFAGEMGYLSRREEAYAHPQHVLPGVRSVVMLAANYRTADPAPPAPLTGRVSRYAWNDGDYHTLIRERLQKLADFLHAQRPGCRTRSVIDTAPLLERDFARAAGLGWFGKNTMLINKRQGSWLFLAGLLTDVGAGADAAARDGTLRNVHALSGSLSRPQAFPRTVRPRCPQMHRVSHDRTRRADPGGSA